MSIRAAAALVLSAAAMDCFTPVHPWAGSVARAGRIGARADLDSRVRAPRPVTRRHSQTRLAMEAAVAAGLQCDAWRDDTIVLPTGFKIAVRIWGNETAAADRPQDRWIALHGWADNAATFDRLAPLMLRQGAACVVAIDAAGHGLSDHRSTYHDVDNVADVVAVTQLLGWQRFSILGHSLGGCVAQAVAATVPEQVVRLMVVEALGWFSHDGVGALRALRKKSREAATNQNQSWTAYSDMNACAHRRAKQNMAGPMTVEDARILVNRGAMPAPSGRGFVWRADPAILLTRIRPSEDFITAILSGVQCPQALIMARDGLFKGANLPRLPLFSLGWSIVVTVAYFLVAGFNFVTTLGRQPLRPEIPTKKSSLPSKVAFLYLLLCRRLVSRKYQELVFLKKGGHHVHLSAAEDVMAAATPWLEATE